MSFKQLILITGVERSGSTLVARVLQFCDANVGYANKMRENIALSALTDSCINANTKDCTMPKLTVIPSASVWVESVEMRLKQQQIETVPFLFKYSGIAQIWPIWHIAFPKAKWIIVRRNANDIVHSCCATAYIDRFKSKQNQKAVGVSTESEGWHWWINQHKDCFVRMHATDMDCKEIWPEQMRDGDYTKIQEVVEWCGLEWNEDVIKMIQTLFK